jgi:hypothetical protein
MNHESAQYTTPEIVDHGTVESITAGASDGDFLDADFDIHTPKKDLTFSI